MKNSLFRQLGLPLLLVALFLLVATTVTTHLREGAPDRSVPIQIQRDAALSEAPDQPDWLPSNPALRDLPFARFIEEAAADSNIEPELLHALVHVESTYNPDARSSKGAVGLVQLKPSTARSVGVHDVEDPLENLKGGARYLREQLDAFGRLDLALSAYNAGPTAVRRYKGIPPYGQTQAYVPKVMKRYKALKNHRDN